MAKKKVEEDLTNHDEPPVRELKVTVDPIPSRFKAGPSKYGKIYEKLLLCKPGEAVRLTGVTRQKAKSIYISLQVRTKRIHGKKLSFRKSTEPDTFFIFWRK
jgi:hypothetical protein